MPSPPEQELTAWETIKQIFSTVLLSPVIEIYSLIPDSILFGSIVLYAITQNLSYGVFSIFIMEVILSHKLFSWVMIQALGPQPRSSSESIRCRAGFKTPELNVRRIFMHDQYPSYAVFSMTSIAGYLGLSTFEFSDTFEAMGSEWKGRSMSAYIFIAAVLFTFILSRAFACSESWYEIAIAFIFGLVTAFTFYKVNMMFFDKEAINFLGLPYLSEKAATGTPIYVCSADPSANSSH
jgi:hypothetical protein